MKHRIESGAHWKKMQLFLKITKWCLLFFFFLAIVGFLGLSGAYMWFSKDLPSIASLKSYKPPTVSTVYADDGTVVAEFFNQRRIVIPRSQMPDHLVQAFVSAEDSRFFQHLGVDPFSIIRAFLKNLQANTIVEGGSTITQQVAKTFFLTPEKKWIRKIKEAILAYNIERNLTKEEILYLYLNQIFFGHGAYGVEAAAQNYFNVSAKDLTLAQSAILAGLPKAPSKYTPFRFPEKAKERQLYVLGRMAAEGYITPEEERKAAAEPIQTFSRPNLFREIAPYYTEYVRQYVMERYGEKALYDDGLKIYTTLNLSKVKAAENALKTGLTNLDKRQGYRGPVANVALTEIESAVAAIGKELDKDQKELAPGLLTQGIVVHMDNKAQKTRVRFGKETGEIPLNTMRWARNITARIPRSVGKPEDVFRLGDRILVRLVKKGENGLWDLRLEQIPEVEGALLCMEVVTGKVVAMMGGRDFNYSQFNRAIQARRQVGSAFKPFVYAAALDKGFTAASIVMDNPFIFRDRHSTWRPRNYEPVFYGPTILRDALAKSRNLISIHVLDAIGLGYTLDYMKKLGLTPPSARNTGLSLALGSSNHSLLEVVRAYDVFANAGKLTDPIFITEIRDRDGEPLEKNIPFETEAISPETAFLMTSLMESVITSGTATRLMPLVQKGWSVAGKTGTTNDFHDAWFVGYTPNYVTGVWVGFDSEKSIGNGETGGRVAAPIWLEFMQTILKNEKPLHFPSPPSGIVAVTIDPKTGLLPGPGSARRTEYFKKGTEPQIYAGRSREVITENDFFKEGL